MATVPSGQLLVNPAPLLVGELHALLKGPVCAEEAEVADKTIGKRLEDLRYKITRFGVLHRDVNCFFSLSFSARAAFAEGRRTSPCPQSDVLVRTGTNLDR